MKLFAHIKFFIYLLLILFLTILFSQCDSKGRKKDEKPLAKVFDNYLYLSDIDAIFPQGTTKEDSSLILKNYINNWIQQKLILNTAEKNLKPEQKNFDKQLAEYKNSLIVYTYESELIKQRLNTEITEDEISKYYNDNAQNFLLKDNIVKVIYVKTPLKSTNLKRIKTLYKSNNDDDLLHLKDICEREAVNYFIDDVWLVFNDLLKEIPIRTYNQEQFLRTNKHIEMQDSLYNYFLNIKSYKIKESISPLSMEKENIRNILINKQKIELIKRTHEEIFKDAQKRNSFEIY